MMKTWRKTSYIICNVYTNLILENERRWKWKIQPGLVFLQPSGGEGIIKEMIGSNIIQILGEDTDLWPGGWNPAAQKVPGGHPGEYEYMPDLMTVPVEIHLARDQFLRVVRDVEEKAESGDNIREHHPVDHLEQICKVKDCKDCSKDTFLLTSSADLIWFWAGAVLVFGQTPTHPPPSTHINFS